MFLAGYRHSGASSATGWAGDCNVLAFRSPVSEQLSLASDSSAKWDRAPESRIALFDVLCVLRVLESLRAFLTSEHKLIQHVHYESVRLAWS